MDKEAMDEEGITRHSPRLRTYFGFQIGNTYSFFGLMRFSSSAQALDEH